MLDMQNLTRNILLDNAFVSDFMSFSFPSVQGLCTECACIYLVARCQNLKKKRERKNIEMMMFLFLCLFA